MRRTGNRTVGSNPTLSANLKSIASFVLPTAWSRISFLAAYRDALAGFRFAVIAGIRRPHLVAMTEEVSVVSFGMWEASAPVFVNSLTNMREWLNKAAEEKGESALMEARLAPDM